MKKYRKNHVFFETPNLLNSYWAGFIAADGNISLKENWKVVPKKTKTLLFPKGLSPNNTKAFICGYIDGDGCITVWKRGRNEKISLSICGTLDVLDGIKNFLEIHGGIKFSGEQIYPSKGIYTFHVGGTTAIKVLNFLYIDSLPLLERKWNKFLEYKKNNKIRKYILWSEEDELILIKNHPNMTIKQIKAKFFPNRTYESVEKKCHYMGLKKHYEIKWTEEEDGLLENLRQNTDLKIKQIHEQYFSYRTFPSVKNRCRKFKRI